MGSNRVIRGGSWNNNAQNLRSANRNNDGPDNRNNNVGFRLVSTCKSLRPEGAVQGLHLRAQAMSRSLSRADVKASDEYHQAVASGSSVGVEGRYGYFFIRLIRFASAKFVTGLTG